MTEPFTSFGGSSPRRPSFVPKTEIRNAPRTEHWRFTSASLVDGGPSFIFLSKLRNRHSWGPPCFIPVAPFYCRNRPAFCSSLWGVLRHACPLAFVKRAHHGHSALAPAPFGWGFSLEPPRGAFARVPRFRPYGSGRWDTINSAALVLLGQIPPPRFRPPALLGKAPQEPPQAEGGLLPNG